MLIIRYLLPIFRLNAPTLVSSLLLMLWVAQSPVYCQKYPARKFKRIDKRARQTPEKETASLPSLTRYLTQNTKKEVEKARAIYMWIANHIVYDDTAFFNGSKVYATANQIHSEKQVAENVLKNQKAVCEGYANLFKKMCEVAGLRSEVVTGYCKDMDGSLANLRHAWNVVRIDKEWYMTDPTWGAGALDSKNKRYIQRCNDFYFLPEKTVFLTTHFPDDPLWQLSNPIKKTAEFATEWQDKIENAPTHFAFQDTLSHWEAMDSTNKVWNQYNRIIRYYPDNEYGIINISNAYMQKARAILLAADNVAKEYKTNHIVVRDTQHWRLQLQQALQYVNTAEGYFSHLPTDNREDWKEYRQNFPLIRAAIHISEWGIAVMGFSSQYLQEQTLFADKNTAELLKNLAFARKNLDNTRQCLDSITEKNALFYHLSILSNNSYAFWAITTASLYADWVHDDSLSATETLRTRLDSVDYFLGIAEKHKNESEKLAQIKKTLPQQGRADSLGVADFDLNRFYNFLTANLVFQKILVEAKSINKIFGNGITAEFYDKQAIATVSQQFEVIKSHIPEMIKIWASDTLQSRKWKEYSQMEICRLCHNQVHFYLQLFNQNSGTAVGEEYIEKAEDALQTTQAVYDLLSPETASLFHSITQLPNIKVMYATLYYAKAKNTFDKMNHWTDGMNGTTYTVTGKESTQAVEYCQEVEGYWAQAQPYLTGTDEKSVEEKMYFYFIMASVYDQTSFIYKLMLRKEGTLRGGGGNRMIANLEESIKYLRKAEQNLQLIPINSKLYDTAQAYSQNINQNIQQIKQTITQLK